MFVSWNTMSLHPGLCLGHANPILHPHHYNQLSSKANDRILLPTDRVPRSGLLSLLCVILWSLVSWRHGHTTIVVIYLIGPHSGFRRSTANSVIITMHSFYCTFILHLLISSLSHAYTHLTFYLILQTAFKVSCTSKFNCEFVVRDILRWHRKKRARL